MDSLTYIIAAYGVGFVLITGYWLGLIWERRQLRLLQQASKH